MNSRLYSSALSAELTVCLKHIAMKLITNRGLWMSRICVGLIPYIPLSLVISIYSLSWTEAICLYVVDLALAVTLVIILERQVKEPRDVLRSLDRTYQLRKKHILTILVCMLAYSAMAQSSIELSAGVVSHTYSNYKPITGTARSISADYLVATEGEWAEQLHINNIGVQATYIDNNSLQCLGYKQFGYQATLLAVAQIQLHRSGAFGLELMPEAGISYTNKTFYNTANQNMIVGSHLAAITGVRASLLVYLNALKLKLGVDATHTSNSNTVTPNDGMNRVALVVGIQQSISNHSVQTVQSTRQSTPISVDMLVGTAGVVTSGYYKHNGRGYYPDTAIQSKTAGVPKYNLSVSYSKHISEPFSLGVGMDGVYTARTLNWQHLFQTYTGKYTTYSNINVGTDLQATVWLGSLAVTAQEGYYIIGQLVGTHVYTSFNIKYYITPWLGLEARSYLSSFGAVGAVVSL